MHQDPLLVLWWQVSKYRCNWVVVTRGGIYQYPKGWLRTLGEMINRSVLSHHYSDVTLVMASQITGRSIVHSTACSTGSRQRKHQNVCITTTPIKTYAQGASYIAWYRSDLPISFRVTSLTFFFSDVGGSVRLVRGTAYGDAKSSCAPGFSGVRRSAAAPDLITWKRSIRTGRISYIHRAIKTFIYSKKPKSKTT